MCHRKLCEEMCILKIVRWILWMRLYYIELTYALAQDTMKLKSTLYVGLILFTLTINMHSFKKTSYKAFLCKSIKIKLGPPQKKPWIRLFSISWLIHVFLFLYIKVFFLIWQFKWINLFLTFINVRVKHFSWWSIITYCSLFFNVIEI